MFNLSSTDQSWWGWKSGGSLRVIHKPDGPWVETGRQFCCPWLHTPVASDGSTVRRLCRGCSPSLIMFCALLMALVLWVSWEGYCWMYSAGCWRASIVYIIPAILMSKFLIMHFYYCSLTYFELSLFTKCAPSSQFLATATDCSSFPQAIRSVNWVLCLLSALSRALFSVKPSTALKICMFVLECVQKPLAQFVS